MDDLIDEYIVNHYHDDLQIILFNAINLINEIEAEPDWTGILNLLTDTNQISSDNISSLFLSSIAARIDYIITQHHITLSQDVSLETKLSLVKGLQAILSLESYDGVDRILTTRNTADNETILTRLMEELTGLSPDTWIFDIEDVGDQLFDKLYGYISNKPIIDEKFTKEHERLLKLTNQHFKILKRYLGDDSCLGLDLYDQGFLPLQPLHVYMSFIGDYFSEELELEQVSLDVYSLLTLHASPEVNVTDLFKTHQKLFTEDRDIANTITGELFNIKQRLVSNEKL